MSTINEMWGTGGLGVGPQPAPFVTLSRPYRLLICLYRKDMETERVKNNEYSGNSQAYDEGSIPFTRSSPLTDK